MNTMTAETNSMLHKESEWRINNSSINSSNEL